jgi:MFS family permease
MILSRMLAGLCGGNITVAQAYIADITPPEDRSRKMGLIGMAFGLGFIFGPILGGVSLHTLGESGPGWIAAVLCAANFVLASFVLVESRKPTSQPIAHRPHIDQWLHTLKHPRVGTLVIVFFLATFCFSCFESTLPLIVSENFKLDIQKDQAAATTVVYLFAYCGIVGAFVQGGAIGRLVKKLGEPKLIAISLVLTAISLAPMPFIKGDAALELGTLFKSAGIPWLELLLALGVLSIGSGLTRPPLFGLLSNLTAEHEQGAVLGVAQSAGSLARIVGPIFATTLHDWIPAVPYVSCAVLLFLSTGLLVQRFKRT